MPTSILIIEDDPAIRRGLADALSYAGYDVREEADGERGLARALETDVSLVLLDLMLPGIDGFEVLGRIRAAQPTLPVIMVTARGAEDDRVRGLREGADDYVTKPFSPAELIARVEAVLRRSPERPADVSVLRIRDIVIDLTRREATMGSGDVRSLTERETCILRYLAGSRDRAIDRRELLHRVWGINPRGVETRTVDMLVARLREKLGDRGGDTAVIATVRGKGYMLADAVRVE